MIAQNEPEWLQAEIAKLKAHESLRPFARSLANAVPVLVREFGVTGYPTGPFIFDDGDMLVDDLNRQAPASMTLVVSGMFSFSPGRA